MGLLSKEKCILCGNESRMFRVKMNDGNFLCCDCVSKMQTSESFSLDRLRSCSPEELERVHIKRASKIKAKVKTEK